MGETKGVGESARGGGEDGCLMSLRISVLRDRRRRRRQNMRAAMARIPTTEMIAMVTLTPKGILLLSLFESLLEGSEVASVEGSVVVEYVVSGIELCIGTEVVSNVVGFVVVCRVLSAVEASNFV